MISNKQRKHIPLRQVFLYYRIFHAMNSIFFFFEGMNSIFLYAEIHLIIFERLINESYVDVMYIVVNLTEFFPSYFIEGFHVVEHPLGMLLVIYIFFEGFY